jgi:hypothetical protein
MEWCEERYEELSRRPTAVLTGEELTHVVIYDSVFDIWNGGLDSLYANSVGAYAADLPRMFTNAGMVKCAEVMLRLNKLVFDEVVPKNDVERYKVYSDFVHGCTEDEIVEFRSLEEALCQLSQADEELYRSLESYAKKHESK